LVTSSAGYFGFGFQVVSLAIYVLLFVVIIEIFKELIACATLETLLMPFGLFVDVVG